MTSVKKCSKCTNDMKIHKTIVTTSRVIECGACNLGVFSTCYCETIPGEYETVEFDDLICEFCKYNPLEIKQNFCHNCKDVVETTINNILDYNYCDKCLDKEVKKIMENGETKKLGFGKDKDASYKFVYENNPGRVKYYNNCSDKCQEMKSFLLYCKVRNLTNR